MIKKTKVDLYIHKLICDKCNSQMKYAEKTIGEGEHIKYNHICNECGHTEYADKIYPLQFASKPSNIIKQKNVLPLNDYKRMIKILKNKGYAIYKEV